MSHDLTARVNDAHEFTAEDLNASDWTALPLEGEVRRYRIPIGHEWVTAEVLEFDAFAKRVDLRIRGRRYSVQLADELDRLIDELGLSAQAEVVGGDIHAPMPGLVREIMVSVGDTVEAGQAVLVLEAMKMENIIRAEAAATVTELAAEVGAAVEKGAMLVRMEGI